MPTFLAVSAPHSGGWLLAMPVSSCPCACVSVAAPALLILADVDVHGQHGLICKHCKQIVRHNVMNDTICWSLSSAGIPASKEPTGLTRLDCKRPDGLTLAPWQET